MANAPGQGRKPKLNNPDVKNKDRAERAKRAIDNNSDFQAIKSPPSRLTSEEKTLYKHIVQEFNSKGILKDLDSSILEEFVVQVSVSRQARKVINEHGVVIFEDDKMKKNPAVDVLNNAVKNIKSLGSSLGLDPISRSSILADVTSENDDETDDIVAKMGG
ncbi:phage terminase small subunit P27 family [Leuconostoc pseudomesenteroides]|uniref:Phage terminase small subunit P27 family n=2 Tax=root TaxID=1 RepID=A0ABT6HD91_LEUPS|nr:phage terminase small subunit P27 family [Leuconostoc pseudomesenteroides]YP_010083078.1 terminase small subunit [Leuconostoc phage phiMH1]ADP69216.1 putative terminase small subunit [Leuconostoc phage phiMH1]MDG9733474.1 phage terminase small subunit P27 family [Leuconostoc pseudomesenteroides]NKZ36085.1 phage terminase small subunit P27 family [Leuconostoc pseudomesenteroides]QQB26683.1 phage terminase small subunit P27 family [Leuconostoc pseudomesenteroides]QQB26731.1 phage terminase s